MPELVHQMQREHKLPHHVGIVMDGNGRWAKSKGKVRLEGHRVGAEVAQSVTRWAKDLGVKQLSLYAFSTENWERSPLEVRGLMSILAFFLPRSLPEMMENGVRFRVLGDIAPLPRRVRKAIAVAIEKTRDNRAIDLVLCLNYGGQQEIIAAAKSVCEWVHAQGDSDAVWDTVTPELFRSMMWRRELEPLDLMIRTGGEVRISNFHLWDAAYAELYFTDVYWPDFSKDDFQDALLEYARRERRLGRTSEQIKS